MLEWACKRSGGAESPDLVCKIKPCSVRVARCLYRHPRKTPNASHEMMIHDNDRFSVFHFLTEGCFLTILFALEPKSATPSTPTLGLAICGVTPAGFLQVCILTNGEEELHESVPAGMFADGGLHEIAVSISRKSHTVTFYLDQKIMRTYTYVYNNGYGSEEMPTFAAGKVFWARSLAKRDMDEKCIHQHGQSVAIPERVQGGRFQRTRVWILHRLQRWFSRPRSLRKILTKQATRFLCLPKGSEQLRKGCWTELKPWVNLYLLNAGSL